MLADNGRERITTNLGQHGRRTKIQLLGPMGPMGKNKTLKMHKRGSHFVKRTAPTIRCYLQSFSRFGGTRCEKVHFSTFSGKLTFQCTRNGSRNPPFRPGSLQDTFIIYSSISHQYIFRKYFAKTKTRIGNLKI